MTSHEFPNYNAIDEAVEQHAGIRNAFVLLGAVIVGIILAVRWALHLPVIGG